MNGASLLLDSTSRKAREYQRKRDGLLSVAEQVFAQKGFRGASMEAIAAAAEYASGTLYRYFENKEILYAAVLEAKMRELVTLLAERRKTAGDPGDALRAIIRAQLEFADANRAFFQIYFRERMEAARAGDQWRRIDALCQQLISLHADVIVAGQERSIFAPGDARLYAIAVEGMVEGLVRSWLTERRERSDADVDLLMQAALRAAAAEPKAAR